MHVIGHQHMGMVLTAIAPSGLTHTEQVELKVFPCTEYSVAVMVPLDQMLGEA